MEAQLCCILIVVVSLLICAAETSDTTEVLTPNGRLVGRKELVLQRQIRSFLGVPFAEPPVKSLRFKPPRKLRPWNGTKEAYTLARACYQERDTTFGSYWGSDMWNANTPVSEDCLYLNLWTPEGAKNLSVMVWLFGGGFWYGSPSLALYDGRALAAEGNVVVVNINYRVGPFGFLFLDHSDVPGNMGLLDQQLALAWIKEHISSFGGDPNKVCLFGESAGAASVVAHMLAPGSQGLFLNGILESGTLDNPWAMDAPEKAFRKSWELVKLLGCDTDKKSMARVADCLRSVPSDKLSSASLSIPVTFMEFYLVIVSRDANFFRGKDAFQSLRNGQYKPVNIMIGINKDEGNFWNVYYLGNYFTRESVQQPRLSNEDFQTCIDTAFQSLPIVAQKAAAFVYRDNCTTRRVDYAEKVNQMVGDYYFTCDSLWLADELVKKNQSQVYIYYFTQRSSTNPWPKWMGVMHGYEIEYVFGIPLLNGTQGGYSQGELKLSREVIRYWSTFASGGAPMLDRQPVRWQSYNEGGQKWYRFGNGDQAPGVIPAMKADECQMWRNVRDFEYYRTFGPTQTAVPLWTSFSAWMFVFICPAIFITYFMLW